MCKYLLGWNKTKLFLGVITYPTHFGFKTVNNKNTPNVHSFPLFLDQH